MSQQNDAEPTGPIPWMIKNSVAANLLMFVILIGGIAGLFQIKQEVFPEFSIDMVTVTVPYPGASPAEVEQGIVLAVEEAVRGLDGVKRITSNSNEGSGVVVIELLLGADPDKVLADVKAEVDRVTTFPEESEKPITTLLSQRREVISLIIAGDQDLRTLHELAEKARARLLEHPEITQVEVGGVRPLEIAIEIPKEQLEALGLSLDQVANQIRATSIELPGGGLDTRGGELLVRVADRRLAGHEFEDIVLRGTSQGYQVRLGDIATITDGYEDTDQATYYNGEPAVRVTAYRVGDETPTGVATAVKEIAESLQAELPETITVDIWADQSEVLEARIDLLVRNARLGLVLVLFLLALFLDVRLAGWVALGIPISFLGAFAIMPTLDASVNMVTLFAFIVTLGMVVDDAIVVGENIYQKVQEGMEPMKAAVEGATEMATPVTFSILTTVAAFSPLFFVPGFIGKIFMLIPTVVISVLAVSLIESFFILPAHLGHTKKEPGPLLAAVTRQQRKVGDALERFIQGPYHRQLIAVLRHRYAAIATAVALFIVAVSTVASGLVPFNFFPKVDGDQVVATARLPYGSPVEDTQAVQRLLETSAREAIAKVGGDAAVRGMLTRLGEGQRTNRGTPSGSHLVAVEVNLLPSDQRDFESVDFSDAWVKATPVLPGVQALKFSSATGPGAGAALSVQLGHEDQDILAEASRALELELRGFSELTNVENTYTAGKDQLDFHLLPAATSLGLTSSEIARQLRSAFFGAEAIREQRGRNELKVMVRLPDDQRRSEEDLSGLRIRTGAGAWVPLSYVARFDRGRSPTSITREEGKRVVTVTADLMKGVYSPKPVLDALQASFFEDLKTTYPGLTVDLVGSQRDQGEAFGSLGGNYVLALFVMYALLAIPFRSYDQPLIIMSAIPFGFVGAILGHLIMGYGLSIISFFGIIALSGVVVNDSLVLIDATNKARAQGMNSFDAIVYGATRRFRPIFLTSVTTFFGLAPMILERSMQARFLIPMAISLGFGVLFATAIVLLIVPSLYLALEDLIAIRSRFFRRVKTMIWGDESTEGELGAAHQSDGPVEAR